MNDIRRTILWVIFGFSLVLLWDQWQVFNGNKPTFLPSSKPAAVASAPAGSTPAGSNGVPTASTAGGSAAAVPTQAAPVAPREQVSVTTDLFKAVIDSEGATVNYLELLKYEEADRTKHVVLFENDSPATRYIAQTGLLSQTGEPFPNHLTPMTPKAGPRAMAEGQNTLEVSFESAPSGGLKYVKTYVFKRGDYTIGVRHEVVNVSDQPRDAQLYMQLLRHGTVAAGTMFGTNTFTGPAAYTNEKKFHKLDFSDIAKAKVEPPPPANDGWIAMVQHYFVSAWLLKGDPASEQLKREFRVKDLGGNLFTVAMVATLPKIAPGQTQVVNSALFAGPEEEKKLEAIAPGLDLVKDYGIFAIISKPLYWLLNELHEILGNWGWAIVALVVLLKAAFYWLNAKAYASMAKMKAINPKIMEMRERLKDKPQEMQQEMMRIYKTEKVNPMGGCFPIVIQIPVFIALYWVLLSSVEMRHAPWIGWITDLSAPDPWYILPVVMTLTSLFQTWLNPTPPDPMQAKLMWIMPLAFSVMFIFFPAGLVLYWITNNVLSIAQQWFINKRLGVLGK
ncbi:insertase [Variovorax sp. Root318D1]|uniref:membrane protein insertase YidC n=1 Tax=Variovorax sp. Root318D1 TaxID=1736513 RepID=UPI0006FB06CA|nr:membrane protein insertase YidC [Variovorax sp. Root318D1]KQU82809.1 insertase [Variovorax sp. Root318D1]